MKALIKKEMPTDLGTFGLPESEEYDTLIQIIINPKMLDLTKKVI